MTDTLPTPAEYRLAPEDIDPARCLARHLGDYLTRDMRWKPAVSYEIQCVRHRMPTGDLCQPCKKRQDTKHRLWLGRVTEDPPAHCHMLGTEWAKKCKWIGDADVVLPPQPIQSFLEEKTVTSLLCKAIPFVAEVPLEEESTHHLPGSVEVPPENESTPSPEPSCVTQSYELSNSVRESEVSSSSVESAHSLGDSVNPVEERTTEETQKESTFYMAEIPAESAKSAEHRNGFRFFSRNVLLGVGVGVVSAYLLYKLFCSPIIPFPEVEPPTPTFQPSSPLQKFLFVENLLKKWGL